MYLTDLHTHSRLSMDGEAPLEEMAQAAVQAGLSAFTVTDHCDLLDGSGRRCLNYDWAPALEQFERTRQAFPQLRLGLGLELGGAYVSPVHARAILAGAGDRLDFVIGSIHNYRECRGGGDFYYTRFTSPQLCHDALDDYFTSMEQLAALPDCYDVLGHIIYPLRYMERDGQHITLEGYYPRIEAILRTAIALGKGMEVNTCRGRTVAQWRPLLERYRALGGTILTVGSDAHRPGDVAKGVEEACQLIKSCGFSRIAVYEGRKPSFLEI